MKKTTAVCLGSTLLLAAAWPATAQQAPPATAQQAPPATASGPNSQDEAPPQPQQEEARRGQTRVFIFVEGSLPYVPTSNTIATKLPLSLQLTPFHVGIVTEALFEERYDTTVSGALMNISNVNIQPGNGVNDFFIIRGFDSLSSTLIMTDGASEPETTFYELYNVENVEVLKGPSGFLYGSNPLAGTVNLVRKQPLPVTLGSARVTLGRFNWIEAAADFNYGNVDGNFFFRVNSVFRDRSGYRDRIEGRTFAINPAATWKTSDSTSLNLNFEYVSADYSPDAGLPLIFGDVVAVDRTTNYQSALDSSDQNIYRLQADYQNEVSDNLTLRNKFYYRGLDWLSNGTLFNGVIPVFNEFFIPTGEFLLSRSLILLDNEQNWIGNQLEAAINGNTGSVSHNLLLGFELARQADLFTLDVGFLPDVPLLDPGAPTLGPPILLPQFSQAGDSRAIIAAPYAIDQITFNDRFQVLAGVRLDTIDFNDDLKGVSRRDTKASPMLGVVFVADENSSIYANYTRSFAPPAPRVQTGQVLPEEGEQIEAGFKREFLDRRGRATFAVYQLERRNIGIPDANGVTQQVGSQRSRGFETELFVETSRGLRFVGSYAYNRAELTEFSEQVIIGVDPLFFTPIFATADRSGPRRLLATWTSCSNKVAARFRPIEGATLSFCRVRDDKGHPPHARSRRTYLTVCDAFRRGSSPASNNDDLPTPDCP
ncbi:MAG: TonB-dependent receptor [Acidobacteria bacterium]|nr:TonB-dependent receptor [Acidobacteriota bacterium]